ncbi:MAG: DnaB-like helicase N-terminal domain-containing protein, partial [Anaerolineae bacterium]
LTVIEELRTQGRLEDVGGPAYITYLINHTPATIYTETYGRVVERAALRRRMLKAASKIAQFAHEFGFSVRTLQEWEQGRSVPRGVSKHFLVVLQKEPEAVRRVPAG